MSLIECGLQYQEDHQQPHQHQHHNQHENLSAKPKSNVVGGWVSIVPGIGSGRVTFFQIPRVSEAGIRLLRRGWLSFARMRLSGFEGGFVVPMTPRWRIGGTMLHRRRLRRRNRTIPWLR